MNFLIKKELLLKGISSAEKNTGKNLTLPVLSNALIKVDKGKNEVYFISTNLETASSISVKTKTEESGSIAVQPRILSALINNLPDENINIKSKDNLLFIEQENYKTSIKGEDDKDFPILPKTNEEVFFTVKSSDLVKGLEQVVNSISVSELKPELTGVLFDINKNELKLASTDSFRLSEKTVKNIKVNNTITKKIIIPSKTIYDVMRSFQDIEGDLVIYIEDNQVVFKNKESQKVNYQFISKIIEGDYPDYSQIIPKSFSVKSITSKKELIQQIKSAGLFTSKINDVKLKIQKDSIEISSENYDVGSFDSSVKAVTEGGDVDIAFNCRYLLDGLNNIEGDEVVLKLNSSETPISIESTETKDYFYILMPIRG